MNRLLREMYSHQAWADAEHWRAMEAFPASLDDSEIRTRQHHYHQTQHAFLWLAEGSEKPFTRTTVADFRAESDLKAYCRDFNTRSCRFLDTVQESRLQEPIVIPWGPSPPYAITVELALTQAALHSLHHRAQNAARLHLLGGEPANLDFIAWLWKGKPDPEWK